MSCPLKNDKIDEAKVRQGITLLLEGIGENIKREGLIRTPDRVARLYKRMLVGYGPPPQITKFKNSMKVDDIQARRCDFLSICEHHLQPFAGTMYIGYIPGDYIIGMDKIDLIVDYFSGKLQLQEHICHEVADFIMTDLKPKGVFVQAYGIHYCAICKGNNGNFASSAVRGVMRKPSTKMETIEMFKQLQKEDHL